MTLGTPVAVFVPNEDQRPKDYADLADVPRPSHGDVTYQAKYGVRASSGGGRASARETVGRVAAGAIADKFLKLTCGIDIVAWVSSVGSIALPREPWELDAQNVTRSMVDQHAVRCPDISVAAQMTEEIINARAAQDSIGGVITCVCRGVRPCGFFVSRGLLLLSLLFLLVFSLIFCLHVLLGKFYVCRLSVYS
jgi:chorismate synthase